MRTANILRKQSNFQTPKLRNFKTSKMNSKHHGTWTLTLSTHSLSAPIPLHFVPPPPSISPSFPPPHCLQWARRQRVHSHSGPSRSTPFPPFGPLPATESAVSSLPLFSNAISAELSWSEMDRNLLIWTTNFVKSKPTFCDFRMFKLLRYCSLNRPPPLIMPLPGGINIDDGGGCTAPKNGESVDDDDEGGP